MGRALQKRAAETNVGGHKRWLREGGCAGRASAALGRAEVELHAAAHRQPLEGVQQRWELCGPRPADVRGWVDQDETRQPCRRLFITPGRLLVSPPERHGESQDPAKALAAEKDRAQLGRRGRRRWQRRCGGAGRRSARIGTRFGKLGRGAVGCGCGRRCRQWVGVGSRSGGGARRARRHGRLLDGTAHDLDKVLEAGPVVRRHRQVAHVVVH
eukprot:scaffold20698_cov111-Isochrysis_galbana.AAC.1